MTGRAVVAVDGGPASDAALGWAIDVAKRLSLDLEIVAVVDLAEASPEQFERLEPPYRQVLDSAIERMSREAPAIHAVSVIHHGPRRTRIVEASRDASMLVIGSDKPGTVVGLLHGTLPLQLADSAVCPLVVVPRQWTPGGTAVVVGQGDTTDREALTFAVTQATATGQPLRMVRAWDVPGLLDAYLLGRGLVFDEVKRVNGQALDNTVRLVRQTYHELIVESRLKRGNPSVVMLEEARTASLVVVGTHRYGPVAGLLLGSIGHDLLLNVPCPIAIVPPQSGH